MQDKHLCCPPYFFPGPTVVPHFFNSRIATAYKHFFATVTYVTVKPLVSAQRLKRLCSNNALPILSYSWNNLQSLCPTAFQPVQNVFIKDTNRFLF